MPRVLFRFSFILLLPCFHSAIYAQCNLSIDVPNDITICDPEFVDLIGNINGDYFDFMWEGSNGFLDNININSQDFTQSTTTYTLSARTESNVNLIINGDFESGNTAFTTQYAHSDPPVTCGNGNHVYGSLGCEGTYLVTSDPSTTHTAFSPCNDHTSGGGNMMIVNGASSLSEIWCQTVNVSPNTDYAFRAWATSVEPSSPAILQFSIDGVLIGSNFNLNGVTCFWESFYALWNSASSTSIEICITNQNLAGGGNDFALDDIFFGEVCTDEAEFTVTIPEVDIQVDPIFELDCSQSSINIESFTSSNFLFYDWYTGNGNIIGSTTNSSITIDEAGFYELEVSDQSGCTAYAYAEVVDNRILPGGVLEGSMSLNCARSATELQFYPDDPNIQVRWTGLDQDSTSFNAIYDMPGDYLLILENEFACKDTIAFSITEDIPNVESEVIANPPINCSGDSTFIQIGLNDDFASIEWSGQVIDSLSSDSLTIFVHLPGTYFYTYTFGNGCSQTDSVEIISDIAPLPYDLPKEGVLNCKDQTIPLFIQSDSSHTTTWLFDNTIIERDTILASQSGLYRVEITDKNLCTYVDSVRITEDVDPPVFSIEVDSIDCINGTGFSTVQTAASNSFAWIVDDSLTIVSDTFFTTEASILEVVISAPNFCTDTTLVEIPASIDVPRVELTYDSIDCTSPIASIRAEVDILGSQIDWVLPSGLEVSGQDFTSTEAGIYEVEVTSPKGCTFQTTFEIKIDTIYPSITLSGNPITCLDTIALLSASTSSDVVSTTWLHEEGLINYDNTQAIARSGGWYTYEAIGGNGCLSQDSILIQENRALPSIPTINDQVLDCSTPFVLLASTANDTLLTLWTSEDNTFSSENREEVFEAAGNYTLSIINPINGCESKASFSIEMDTTPIEYTFIANDITCLERMSEIEIISGEVISSVDFDPSLDQASSTRYTLDEGGVYAFTLRGSNQCPRTREIAILVDTIAPVITTFSDSLQCNNREVILRAEVDESGSILNWIGPSGFTSSILNPLITKGGQYTLEAINPDNGCRSESTLIVTENLPNIQFDALVDQGMCHDDPSSIQIINIGGGEGPYQTQIFDPRGQIQEGSNLEISGIYILEIEDRNACISTDSIFIEERLPIDVELGLDLEITKGEDAQLSANTNISEMDLAEIEWFPEDFLSCSDCLDPVVTPEEDIQYTLILTDIYGCQVVDSIRLRLNIIVDLVAPNIFSPNQDNSNDYFTIYANEEEEVDRIESLLIYDRWGEEVFSASEIPINDERSGWNGQFNNDPAISGVYVYVAQILLKSGEIVTLQGDVTLIR